MSKVVWWCEELTELTRYSEKTGIPRLREALEANDWAGDDDELDLDGLGIDSDDEDGGFSAEATELEMEMFGMKRAILEGGDVGEEFRKNDDEEGDEDRVDDLEGLMMRMQGIKGRPFIFYVLELILLTCL